MAQAIAATAATAAFAVKTAAADPALLSKANAAAASIVPAGSAKSATSANSSVKPATASVTPSSITTIGQAAKPDLGLFNKAGVVEKPAVATTAAKSADSSAGTFIAGKDAVSVDILQSDSGYENKIFYSTDNFATRTYIGIDNKTGTVDLGTFKPGTKIEFGIENDLKQFFRTGAASANSDNFQHGQVSKTADGIQIGFEDLKGGGDRDFNDAIIRVRNVPAAPAPAAKDLADKSNRSGLDDGTNPGNGAGRDHAPNQGAVNRAGSVTTSPAGSVTTAPVVAKPVVTAPPVIKPAVADVKPLARLETRPAIAPTVAVKPADATVATAAPTPTPTAKPVVKPVVAQATPVPDTKTKDNRSGLGDGTNPGKGAGTAKATNTGTLNPGGLATADKSKLTQNVAPVAVAPTARPGLKI